MDLPAQLIRRPLVLLLMLAAILPFSLRGAWFAFSSTSNRVDEWLPPDFAATRDLGRFVELFGSDELLMISWDGCRLGDERVALFAARLLSPPPGASSTSPFFRRVTTADEVIDVLCAPPLNLSREDALQRTSGWLTSPHGEEAGLIALVSAQGAADRSAARDHVWASADAVPGLSAARIHVAGPTIESVAIDRASQKGLLAFNIGSFGVCLLVMAACLRSMRAGLVILGLALFSEQLCLALIWYSGGQMDSILLLAANLTFVLSVAIGIHLFNYYRDAQEVRHLYDAPVAAYHAALKPTFMSVMTTVISLISLSVSVIRPIEKFGVYAAVSLVAAMGVVLLCLPGHFALWPLVSPATSTSGRSSDRHFRRLAGAVARAHRGVIVGAVALFALGLMQLPNLRTSVGISQLLSPENQLLKDYRTLEQSIGPLIPVEIVLEMPVGDPRAVVEQFRVVAAAHNALSKIPDATIISSVNFADEPPTRLGGIRQVVRAAAFRRALVENQQRMADLGYVRFDDDRHFWRITLRTSALEDRNYGRLLDALREQIDQVLADFEGAAVSRVLISGGVPVVYQAQQRVLDDLISSFGLAFVLIAVTLSVIFRSVATGLLCMLPNVLPTAITFGGLAWLGRPVEVGTVLTASAALGISVDDTLHFITWFQAASRAGATRRQATVAAYQRCGGAMVQTTLACGLGLSVFALSDFLPIARFAVCITTLLALALVGDLIVLPALLVSPAGKLFTRSRIDRDATLDLFAPRAFESVAGDVERTSSQAQQLEGIGDDVDVDVDVDESPR